MEKVNTMRTCNFFHSEVQRFSGGTTRPGCIVMTTGTTFKRAITILKSKYWKRLLYIKSFLPEEQYRRVMDYLTDGWWKK